MSARGSVLSLEGVSKVFQTRVGLFGPLRVVCAVRGVSLAVRRGETFGLVGESGSGKTTLARLMVALLKPTGGRVCFSGVDLSGLSGTELRRARGQLQIVFQDPVSALDPRQTVFQALTEVLEVHGIQSLKSEREQVERLLGRVGLRWEDAGRYPHELSGGQCQRVGIARVVALSPAVLVADEPVSQLDVSTQAHILSLLGDLRSELGLTFVMIAHDLSVVRQVVERIAVMYAGSIVEMALTADLFSTPLHPYTRLLLDSVPRPGARARPPAEAAGRREGRGNGGGCPFFDRCADCGRECAVTRPVLERVGDGDRWVRCLRL